MADLYANHTPQNDISYYYFYDANETFDYYYDNPPNEYAKVRFIMHVVTCIIISIGLPLTLMAIYALYSLVRNDHVAPIYVINLLISDLIQLCCMIVWEADHDVWVNNIVFYVYNCGLVTSVCFMVCVALERYLVIAQPLWYRFRRTIKISVVVCVVIWALPPLYFLTCFHWATFEVSIIVFSAVIAIPFPLFIFFLVGTLKVLSASISVPSKEKRRIVAIVVVVLLIYTLLFLPSAIWPLAGGYKYDNTFNDVSFMLLKLSPLADLVLYIFIRKETIDKLLASVCCCKMESNDNSISTV